MTQKPPNKKQKLGLPSLDEQMQLNQAESLVQSNLLTLQISELVNEVHLHDSKPSKLRRLHAYIDTIKSLFQSSDGVALSEKWLKMTGRDLSLMSEDHTGATIQMSFHPPEQVEIIGSFAHNSITSPFINVDLAVTIPTTCFEERFDSLRSSTPDQSLFIRRDILNYIYFDKRNLYMSYLHHILQTAAENNDQAGDSFLSYFKGDFKKIVLVLRPSLPGWPHLEIKIIPVVGNSE